MLSVDTRPSTAVVPARPAAATSSTATWSSDGASASSFDQHLHDAVAVGGDEDRPTHPSDTADDPTSGPAETDSSERAAAARRRERRVTADPTETADPPTVVAAAILVTAQVTPTEPSIDVAGLGPGAHGALTDGAVALTPSPIDAGSVVGGSAASGGSAPTAADVAATTLPLSVTASAASTPGIIAAGGTPVDGATADDLEENSAQSDSAGSARAPGATVASRVAGASAESPDVDPVVAPPAGQPAQPAVAPRADAHSRPADAIPVDQQSTTTSGAGPTVITADSSSSHDAASHSGVKSGAQIADADVQTNTHPPAPFAVLDGSPRTVTERSAGPAPGSSLPTGLATTTGQALGSTPGAARRAGPLRLDVDLAGEGLGPLRFRATTIGGQLRVSLTATDEHVRAALSNHSAELRRDMEAAGLDLASLDVGGSPAGRHGPGAESRQPFEADGRLANGGTDRPDAASATASTTDRPRSSGAPTRPTAGRLDRLL